jgi:Kef-type K+ transport system membrane component KefB
MKAEKLNLLHNQSHLHMAPPLIIAAIVFVLCTPSILLAAESSGHADPIAPVLIALVAILAAAKLGAEAAERLHLPAVLGELAAGIILGNLALLNAHWGYFEVLRANPIGTEWAMVIDSLGRLGVIILLFEVGLESTVKGMLSVGGTATLVAILGVVAPLLLGVGISALLIREIPAGLATIVPSGFSVRYVHLFIGAVLCATSVGITARVFKDLGKLQIKEARIILGAAVIDDVLGLVILAVVSGVVQAAMSGGSLDLPAVLRLIGFALLFLVGSLMLGTWLVPRIMKQLARLRTAGMMLISALLFAFGLSWLANFAGLAPIVGAFAAGLILEPVHFHGFKEEIHIEQLIRPVSNFLVPIFFVLMGIQVRLEAFADLPMLGLAAGISIAAILGKLICGLGVLQKGLDRLSVSIGMIPRGEVGLIFAGVGRSIRIIDDATFSAAVLMVMITTIITPPLLKLSLGRRSKS